MAVFEWKTIYCPPPSKSRCEEGICDGGEERQAVLAAHEGVHQVLGVGHEAEDAEVGGKDAGDVAGGVVAVPAGVAEGDEVLGFQAVQGLVVSEVVAVAMSHGGAEGGQEGHAADSNGNGAVKKGVHCYSASSPASVDVRPSKRPGEGRRTHASP